MSTTISKKIGLQSLKLARNPVFLAKFYNPFNFRTVSSPPVLKNAYLNFHKQMKFPDDFKPKKATDFDKIKADFESKKNGSPNSSPSPPQLEFDITNLVYLVLGGLILYSMNKEEQNSNEITFLEFQDEILPTQNVEKLEVINQKRARVYMKNSEGNFTYTFPVGSVDLLEQFLNEFQDNMDPPPTHKLPIIYTNEGQNVQSILQLIPSVMVFVFLIYLGKQANSKKSGLNGMLSTGKSKATLYDPQSTLKVRFNEIAGMKEAKTEIMEFVEFLKTPEKFVKIGAKLPRGAILSGAPGTGKTMLAKATACEADVPFFSVSGSEFVEMFSGVGSSRVRDLFSKAKAQAPSMIWIDEIDAIGKARSSSKGSGAGGNDERESTLNQLLVEMDGFESDDRVVVLAGTNRVDMLDKALLRPGRFDRNIFIDLPTLDGRTEIFDVHLKKVLYDQNVKELSGKLAAMTPGFSGADIANCCNEAALLAARDDLHVITLNCFERAIDRVIAGLPKETQILPPNKLKIVAYHEAGHAVTGWFLKYADPLVKVTIIPHGGSTLGYAQLLPKDSEIITEKRLKHLMCVALGGRVSEQLFFKSVSTGASDDFQRTTEIARRMVCDYLFSPNVKSVLDDGLPEEQLKTIDLEINKLVLEALDLCKQLLTKHKELVKKVAEELLKNEELTRSQLVKILGERPFKNHEHEAFRKYLDV